MLCIIVGKSGSGKSTIKKILEMKDFRGILSSTSRDKRKGEIDGIDYIFRTKEEMLEMASKGKLVEYQFIGSEMYGIENSQLVKGELSVAVVGMEGLRELKKMDSANVKSFYLKVPFYTRAVRMFKRKDSLFNIIERLLIDRKLFKNVENEVDYIIDGCAGPGHASGELIKKIREWD